MIRPGSTTTGWEDRPGQHFSVSEGLSLAILGCRTRLVPGRLPTPIGVLALPWAWVPACLSFYLPMWLLANC